jgi:serine O-acetyltransferase
MFIILITCGIRLHREVTIGKNFHLIHSGNIHIHPSCIIGDNCGIQHDVTLGNNMERRGAPVLGNNVYIGVGAKILGPVTIGDGARIAANSLVVSDVPPGATAIGVPARILNYTGRKVTKTLGNIQSDQNS